MTRVVIETDVELYPQTVLHIGEDEIVFPDVPQTTEETCGVEVPDATAARWKEARDTWKAVQKEAAAYLEQA